MQQLADISCFETLQTHANNSMISGMACFNESSELGCANFIFDDSAFVSVFNAGTMSESTSVPSTSALQAMQKKLKPVRDLIRMAVIFDMLGDGASLEFNVNGSTRNSKQILKNYANNIKVFLDKVNTASEVTKHIKYLQYLIKSGVVDLKKADKLKLPITAQDRNMLGLLYRPGDSKSEKIGQAVGQTAGKAATAVSKGVTRGFDAIKRGVQKITGRAGQSANKEQAQTTATV